MKMWLEAMKQTVDQMFSGQQNNVHENHNSSVAVEVKVDMPKDLQEELGLDYPVLVMPMESPVILRTWLVQNATTVNEFMLKLLTMAVVRGMSEVILFRLGDSDKIAFIDETQYASVISDMQKYFTENEQFENAAACVQLYNRYCVERVIMESQSQQV